MEENILSDTGLLAELEEAGNPKEVVQKEDLTPEVEGVIKILLNKLKTASSDGSLDAAESIESLAEITWTELTKKSLLNPTDLANGLTYVLQVLEVVRNGEEEE